MVDNKETFENVYKELMKWLRDNNLLNQNDSLSKAAWVTCG